MSGIISRRIALAVFVALSLLPPAAAHAAFPGANGKIAFTTDRDQNNEIYSMNADGSGAVDLTANPAADSEPAWSPDGTRIAFTSDRDGNDEIYVMDADGSGATRLTNDPLFDGDPAWSPDGAQIVFSSDRGGAGRHLYVMNADGTLPAPLTTGSDFDDSPDWSPDGGAIVFVRLHIGPSSAQRDIYRVRPDGNGLTNLTNTGPDEFDPAWSPDGALIAFVPGFGSMATMRPDGSDRAPIQNTQSYGSPAWSPQGDDIVVQDLSDASDWEITTISEIGTQARRLTENSGIADTRPDWQPLPPSPPIPGYVRPKGASPIRVPLVPASEPCLDPNERHGPPLAFPSCAPPHQTSPYLTVGTPDANGRPAQSTGYVRLAVFSDPPDPDVGPDVLVTARLTDVRCRMAAPGCTGGALSDYAGELQLSTPIRVTDRYNGHTLDRPATFDHFEFPITVPCAATSDAGVGGTCSVSTTFDAVLPGVVVAGKRAVWQMGPLEARDGGADGLAETNDNTVFAAQGVFIP